ncbi:hypothetical protein WMW72_08100 [Paenibacillus filicis]|uniref:Transposase n=1 Tax=Paenibacillus filicis TaxID=669464 RepID=A0ABU9DI64_9BACL
MTYTEVTRFAVITELGIMYQAAYYSCPQAIQEQWFSKAIHNGGWAFQVCFRTKDKSRIYIFHKNELIVCYKVKHQTIPDEIKSLYFVELERLKRLKRSQRKYRGAGRRRLKKLKDHQFL